MLSFWLLEKAILKSSIIIVKSPLVDSNLLMDKEPLTQLGLVKEQSSGSSMQTTLKKNLTWASSCHLLSYGNYAKTKVCIPDLVSLAGKLSS